MIKNAVDSRYLNPALYEQLKMIDNQLKEHDFLAGKHLTGADILSQFMLKALSVSVPNFKKFEEIEAYLQRIENLPSYQIALKKGGFNQEAFNHY